MARFFGNGCLIEIADNQTLNAEQVEKLKNLILEVGPMVDLAIGASSAPRHADRQGEREEFVDLRRRWFGTQRGRVRHTFRDILLFLENETHTLKIGIRAAKDMHGAHAYTPESQVGTRREIYLCEKFFQDTNIGQMSTIVHELTHLIRETIDFDPSFAADTDFFGLEEMLALNPEAVAENKRNYFLNDLPFKDRARSAYNFEYFMAELIKEGFEGRLPDAATRS